MECLEDATVILNLFDNSIYKSGSSTSPTEPLRLNGSYHLLRELNMVSEDEFKRIFEDTIPILRAARGTQILVIGPLERYTIRKCCENEDHITNFDDPSYIGTMKASVTRLGKLLKSLVHMRRIKNSKVLNPCVLMGMVGLDAAPEDIWMWGRDPVHPKHSVYNTMAARLLDEVGTAAVLHPKRPTNNNTGPDHGASLRDSAGTRRHRESWTSGSQTVADRQEVPRPHHRGGHGIPGYRRGAGNRGAINSGGRQHSHHHHRKPYGRR